MKNVSIDDDIYDLAAARAAEQDMSVSALIETLVRDIAKDGAVTPEEFKRLEAEEIELRKQVDGFSSRYNIDRDSLYDRSL